MTTTDRIWHLIARALHHEASPQELEELTAALREDPSLLQQFELLTRVWNERDNTEEDEENARQTILRIINKAETEEVFATIDSNRHRIRRRNWLIAASVVILLGLGGWLMSRFSFSTSENDSVKPESLVTAKGSRTRSLLPDGTTVWLNAGSKLYFESDFSGATREVRLDGEAFFDVVKKPSQPFIVHTSGIDIKVLGTAFNVKAYPEDKNVETTLYRGSVKVFRQEETESKAISMRPNQKLILPKEAAPVAKTLSEDLKPARDLSAANYLLTVIDSTKEEKERYETAWLYSRLEFRGDNFEELAYKLERWYNVRIDFTDEKVRNLTFNGSFERESIEEAFAALKVAVPLFDYKINNHVISVGSSK